MQKNNQLNQIRGKIQEAIDLLSTEITIVPCDDAPDCPTCHDTRFVAGEYGEARCPECNGIE